MPQDNTPGNNGALPRLVIDDAHCDRLADLAYGAMQRFPDAATRLLEEIERAEIVNTAEMPAKVVNIGSKVTYRDNTSGHVETVVLVFPNDADISGKRVSVLTPVGAALIGLTEGDTLDWTTRNGERRLLTVLEVGAPT